MSYSKPMVTIELDEYIELKKKTMDAEDDMYLFQAKQVIAALLNSNMDLNKAVSELRKNNISFSINKMGRIDNVIHPEYIFIKSV